MSDATCQEPLPIFVELLRVVSVRVKAPCMYYKDDEFICPACSYDLEGHIPRFIAMDGKSSHKCEKHPNITIIKSKETKEAISNLWVDPESVAEYSKVQGEKATDPLDSNFGANNNPLKTRKKYPVNGVFGAACARHVIVLKITDITAAGERYMYPLAVINQLLQAVNSYRKTAVDSPQFNVMYDIVCKLGKSLKEHFPGLMQKSKIDVPIFHSYAHGQHCQVKTNPRYRDGFGLTDGECLERLWSSLNRYVAMTRGMHQYNRQIVLYRALVNRNKEKKDKMGMALENKLKIALKMKKDLAKDLEGVSDSDIRSAELKWKEHVELFNRSSSYAVMSDLLPAGLDERTRYMVLLSFEYRILSQNTEENVRNDPDLSDIKKELVEIRNEMKVLNIQPLTS